MIIETFFPTVVGVSDFEKADEIEKQYSPYLQDLKQKYSKNGCFCLYEVHKDPAFDELTNWVTNEINKFAKVFNFTDYYVPVESWFNDYQHGSYQGMHTHAGSIFSVVYYLKGSEEGAKFIIKSPVPVDLKNPENNSVKIDNESHLNSLSWTSAYYSPKKGRLLMFRSLVQHGTETTPVSDSRLSITYTYDKK
tara:strand:+ start:45 stop:623 length:579 start_codon:yes stop_codon:yes gene_type:complete